MKKKKAVSFNAGKFIVVPGCGFEIATTQATQSLWKKVMGNDPSYFKGKNLPVENVSYSDIQEFLEKLNSIQKKYAYRLPTEQEWLVCFGKDLATDGEVLRQAWCYETSNNQTHDVGTKDPNEFGIFDMRGNVWEWTSSLYDSSGSNRVVRGGSWYNSAQYLRSAYRYYVSPGARFDNVGFRLVRTLRSALLPSYPSHRACDSREEAKKVIKQIVELLNKLEKLFKD